MKNDSSVLAGKLKEIWKDMKLLVTLSAKDRNTIRSIRSEKLTYLSTKKLLGLAHACRHIERSGIKGTFIETGCALGGSSILIATIKNSDRIFYVYDVFGMIPPPTADDTHDVHERYKEITTGKAIGIGGDKYYGYQDNLYDLVESNMRRFGIIGQEQNVLLIEGLIQDTLHVRDPVALAHVDVDWYEPVLVCLKRIYPRLVAGGSIILDDYHDWGGCRKATDEFLKSIVGKYTLDDTFGSMKITKICN